MLKIIPFFVLIGLCAACTPPLLSVTSVPVDVNVADESQISDAVGYEPIYIRTYSQAGNEPKLEIKDVTCEAKAPGFDAQVITPGILNLPDRRNLSSDVIITCTKDGITETGVAMPFNRTSENIANAGVGAGSGNLIGAFVVQWIKNVYAAERDKSEDDWGYRNVDIIFSQ
jgi:hypothetical protein